MRAKIYVGDLLDSVRERDLEEKFSKYGRVEDVWVSRSPPGYAFVIFSDHRDAERVVRKLNGRTVCGTRVHVEMARRDNSARERDYQRGRPSAASKNSYSIADYPRFASPHYRRVERRERYPRRDSHRRYRSPITSKDPTHYPYMPPMSHHTHTSPRHDSLEYHSPLGALPQYPSTFSSYSDYYNYYNSYQSGYYSYPTMATNTDSVSATGYVGTRPVYYNEPKPPGCEPVSIPSRHSRRSHGRVGSEKSLSRRSHRSPPKHRDRSSKSPKRSGNPAEQHNSSLGHRSSNRNHSHHRLSYEDLNQRETEVQVDPVPPAECVDLRPSQRRHERHHLSSRSHHSHHRHGGHRSSTDISNRPPHSSTPKKESVTRSPTPAPFEPQPENTPSSGPSRSRSPSQQTSAHSSRQQSPSDVESMDKFRSPSEPRPAKRRREKSPPNMANNERVLTREPSLEHLDRLKPMDRLKPVRSCHDYDWPVKNGADKKYRSSGSTTHRSRRPSKSQV